MEKDLEKSSHRNFRALADTSSVVAHDLSAQLHVLQFCLDELSDHVNRQGQEYLKRMNDSTRFISQLVDSYRRGLKVNINDEHSFKIEEVYEGALELLKNHYFTIVERVAFSTNGQLNKYQVKNNGRRLLHVIFGLYSLFLDEVRATDPDEHYGFSFHLSGLHENSRFVMLRIETKGHCFSEDWLTGRIDRSVPEKGKIRQFQGLALIKECIAEKEDFLSFQKKADGNIIEILVPLESKEEK
jgi:hypothetical protein